MSCRRPNTPKSNPYDLGELERTLRDRLWTMFLDCQPTNGLTLVSGFRDPGRQWDLRHARCPGRECDRACKGYPVTAVPYASAHQKRAAADIGGRALQWAIDHRAEYGLGLTVRSENWHFETDGVDARTGRRIGAPRVRIVAYPGPSYDGTAVPGPTAPVPRGARALREGMRGDDVLAYQRNLNAINAKWGLGDRHRLDDDGIFGRRTAARSNEFERWHNATSAYLAIVTKTTPAPRLAADFVATAPSQWYAAVWRNAAVA